MRTNITAAVVLLQLGMAGPGMARAQQPDFNGDNRADLAISVMRESVGPDAQAGAVHVLYGAAGGVSTAGNQFWTQDSQDILDNTQPEDWFGRALAWGDFDGDGFSDLAVSAMREDVGGAANAGIVHVIPGSAAGLTGVGNQIWHQNKTGIVDAAEPEDAFGRALAAGDFDGDGFADLAVGVAGEDVGAVANAGAVQVLYGGPTGLGADGDQLWTEDSPGVVGVAEAGDVFGIALAVGDFDGDGRDDLAVGATREDVLVRAQTRVDAGQVTVLYGSPAGLTAGGSQAWSQVSAGVEDVSETGDLFGETVAAGDFDDDGFDDLVIGVPFDDIGSVSAAGAVNVLYGSAAGLTATGDQFWHQDAPGIVAVAGKLETFGSSLAAGDFDGDGRDDLAIGVPNEGVSGQGGAGAVSLIYGSAAGLTATGNQLWHQDRFGVEDTAEPRDCFGASVAAGDFNGDLVDDLAVGAPCEDSGSLTDTGVVHVLNGSASGLTATGDQLFSQATRSIPDDPEKGDYFGDALIATD